MLVEDIDVTEEKDVPDELAFGDARAVLSEIHRGRVRGVRTAGLPHHAAKRTGEPVVPEREGHELDVRGARSFTPLLGDRERAGVQLPAHTHCRRALEFVSGPYDAESRRGTHVATLAGRRPAAMLIRAHLKSIVAAALVVGTLVACATADTEEEAPSAEAGFCGALASSYSKCTGSSGPSASCAASLGADCAKLSSILSTSVLNGATTCVNETACGSDPLGCLGKALGDVKATAAQTKLATDYCESCSVVGGEACKTAFFGTASVPGLAFALLPFGDAPLEAVDEACTKSSLGKTVCQSGFTTCLTATLTKFLATSISVDSGKCLLDGIKEGISNAGTGGGGGDASASGCTDCAGCCTDGKCQTGDTVAACGSGGGACESCQAGDCTAGKCTTTCGPDNCDGCCQPDGTCDTGKTTAACGTRGDACTACSGTKTCESGTCIDASCKATCASGCCSGTGCQAGNTTAACGTGGNACTACGGGQTCTANKCTTSTTATFDFLAVSAKLPAKNQSGGNWDGFGGLPDPLVTVTSGAVNASSTNKSDTLTPTWNEKVITNLTANALKASLRIDVTDADVAFNDVVGGCAIALNGTEFDGALHTANCPTSATGVAFSLVYRLVAH